jgi:hypothetical protein
LFLQLIYLLSLGQQHSMQATIWDQDTTSSSPRPTNYMQALYEFWSHASSLVLQPRASNDTKLGNVQLITCVGTTVRDNALVTPYRMVEYDERKT